MAEHEEDGFSFGDFKFATPPPPSHLQPQPQSQINGVTSTSNIADVWGDFFFNPSPPQSTPSQSQFNLPDNNGFSSSFNWAQPVSGPSPIRVDPGPTKPAIGASPLSLFGEVDPNPNTQSNGNFDFTGFNMNFNGVASDLSIENGNKKNDNNEEEDEDEWEFKGAFSGNSVTEQGNSKDGSVVSKSKIELSMKKEQEKQDASQFVDHKLGVNGLGPQSIDFFAAPYENETNHQSSEMAVGIKSNASTTNGFMWDPFPEVELIDNGGGISASSMNQDDDFDDFGDFIDASREVVSKEQQEQVGNDVNPAEVQLPNGEAQEKQTQTKHSRGALPLSLFCDDSEESSDSLNLQNEVAQMPTLNPVNSFSGQKPAISIKDLVSNLYSEAQLTSSVDSTVKPAENGVHSPPKAAVTTSLDEDDDWDDDSWEFKGAYSDNGVGEQLSTAIPGNVAQKQLPELQIYIDFYDELRGSLCFLLSCQLDELKKARSSDVNGNGGKAEALDDEMQEVSKLLEEKMISKEVFSKKDLERSTCLDKFLDVLQGPNFNVIEAEFSLTKKLQLAVSDWRVTAELLRHAISMLKVLLLGTADDQSLYVLTWSKVINVCVQELSHGASIWKRASEKNVQHQILSDSRGQQFIQALGEIYKVVEILGLSAKVYKQWILLSPSSDPSQFFSVLFECGALWVNSGLERALQNLSDGIDTSTEKRSRLNPQTHQHSDMVVSSSISPVSSSSGVFSNTLSRSDIKLSRFSLPSSTRSSLFSLLHPSPLSRNTLVSQWGKRWQYPGFVHASTKAASLEAVVEKVELPKGDMWSVHKFGGTCVGCPDRIKSVAEIVVKDVSERKLVVVSAMSKVTDMMYDLIKRAQSRDESFLSALDAVLEKHTSTAKDMLEGDDLLSFLSRLHDDINNLKAMLRAIYIAGHATESFTDFVVGYGELWSAQMLSLVIKQKGYDCKWMDTRDVLVVNPTSSNQVDPDFPESERRLDKWFSNNPSSIIIATGFIATTPDNIPTTLKRDGSDFSAAIMGALLRAGQVTIWTDVDGVYSADPRKVSEAVILHTLSYQEAWEMSYFGANVLHPRTIIPVMRYDIPIVIRNVFNLAAPGTKICRPSADDNGEHVQSPVKGFATIDNLALVNVEGTGMAGVPGTASAIFSTVKDVGANVIMISQASSEHSVCFAVPEKEVNSVAEALRSRFNRALDAGRLSQVAIIPNCSILATVGQKMASTPGVSATLFNALAKANINIRAIAQGCSEYNITVVVKRDDCIKALRAVHSRFYLSRTTLSMGIIGPGLIGATLLDQLRDQTAELKEKFNIDLRVMGITSSKKMLLSDSGIDLSNWKEQQSEQGKAADMQKFVQHVHGNHFIPNTVLVDCTADSYIASHYYDWLRKGIHIITPNKKANSGPLDQYLKLRSLQRQSYTHYFYEATVGAGLPIISTLRGLLETGDKILSIEGIFSGTLSYIFNKFKGGRKFSEVVTEAKQAGYTEPDPRDDLSGTDVARKVIILARECGMKLELSDIPPESLVPEPLRAIESAEEFMQQLPHFDEDWAKKLQAADGAGEVLRYVGVVDVTNEKGLVKLKSYKKDHPFAQLSGSDNIILFTTERYKEQPLIVRGPGAGAEVTAGGVFSDILRLASYLGAPS